MSESPLNADDSADKIPGTSATKVAALDKAFPPVWIVALLIAIASVLLLVLGFKVMNLEQERAQIAVAEETLRNEQKQLTERLKRHQEILTELPSLEDKRGILKKDVALLEGKKDALETRLQTATDQLSTAQEKYTETKHGSETAIKQRDLVKSEYSELIEKMAEHQGEIKVLSNKSKALQERVTMLDKQRAILEKRVAELQQEKASLDSQVIRLSSLIRGKENALKDLQKDNKAYASLAEDFRKVLLDLQESGRLADQASNDLKAHSEGLQSSTDRIENQSRRLVNTADKIEQDGSALSQETQNYASVIKKVETEIRSMKSAIQAYQEVTSKAQKNMTDSQTETNKYIETLKTELATTKTLLADLEMEKGRLNAVISIINDSNADLGKRALEAMNAIGELSSNMKRFDDDAQKFARSNAVISAQADILQRELKDILNTFEKMAEQSSTVDTTVSSIKTQNKALSDKITRIEKLIEEVEKLKTTPSVMTSVPDQN